MTFAGAFARNVSFASCFSRRSTCASASASLLLEACPFAGGVDLRQGHGDLGIGDAREGVLACGQLRVGRHDVGLDAGGEGRRGRRFAQRRSA